MWQYQNTDELYHYGVLGMKWGHRKSPEINRAMDNYNRAKGRVAAESANLRRKGLKIIAGTANTAYNKKAMSSYNNAKKNQQRSGYKVVDAMAKYKYDKVLKKTGDKNKAEKASIKVHTKAMAKGFHGLPGSISDYQSGGQNTKYISHLTAVKGKKYAAKVEKKYKNRLVTQFATAAAVSAGAYAYSLYRLSKI